MAGDTLYTFVGLDVAQPCAFPSTTRRSRGRRHFLCHPITPPSTPPSAGSQHAARPPPPEEPMDSIISRAVPDVTVRHVRPRPSLRSQRHYDVHISDGSNLHLALPSPLMVKLLRSEQGSISSEAAVLRWLTQLGIETPRRLDAPVPVVDAPAPSSHDSLSKPRLGSHLAVFLPRLLAHADNTNEFGIEYNVLRLTSGVPIIDLTPSLDASERRQVELRIGQFSRRISRLTSPTGRFGPAFAVLPSWSAPTTNARTPVASRDANARMSESQGTKCWSTAFHSMLEAVLRDGEDMAVMLSYATIRTHFKRWAHALDKVVTPRLVAVDVGSELNTLVVRKSADQDRDDTSSTASSNNTAGSELEHSYRTDREEHVEPSPSSCEDAGLPRVEVTGMKDWSNFIFGDPLFATMFSNDPSPDFLKGFSASLDDDNPADMTGHDRRTYHGIVDDEDTAHVRLLLYGCYHTTMQIVKEFYRPQRDSGLREMAARKKLTHILGQLEDLSLRDETLRSAEPALSPSPRRRLSGESTPAKKTKGDAE